MVAYASSLDTVGLMSKKLDHLQTLFGRNSAWQHVQSLSHSDVDVLNVADDKDPTSIGEEFRLREKEQATHGDLSTVRVGVSLVCSVFTDALFEPDSAS